MLKLYLKLGMELSTGGSAFSFFNLVQYFEQLFRNFTRNVFIMGNFFIYPDINYWSRDYFHDPS